MTNDNQTQTPSSHDTANPAPIKLGKPLGKMIATTDATKKQEVISRKRKVRFDFYAAEIDVSDNPVVQYSASNLINLPYVIASANDKTKLLTPDPKKINSKNKVSFVYLTGTKPLFSTFTVDIPDDVDEVVIYLGNDAYASRRLHPLFKLKPNEQGVSIVTIYETHKVALENLRKKDDTKTKYPITEQSQLVQLDDGHFVGYLTGDVWKDLSYEFGTADIKRFCKKSTLTRPFAEDRGRGNIGAPPGPTQDTEANLSALKEGDTETLIIEDWVEILQPIYSGDIQNLTGKNRKEYSCRIDLPTVNIRLQYIAGAFNNALGAGENVTIADVLKRTHPLAYKGLVEAAWKSGTDVIGISSTWRPMLGSILHRMGVSIDVTSVDDLDDRDAKNKNIPAFTVHLISKKADTLYSKFESMVFKDKDNLGGFIADPWNRKADDHLHETHLHVSATDSDAV